MGRYANALPAHIQEKVDNYNENPTEKDWREPGNREELFLRYYAWREIHEDLDQRWFMRKVTENYDYEKKLWYSMVFGMTYHASQTYAYTELWDNALDISMSDLEDWHQKNWRKTNYGGDCRYNKGFFVRQTQSVREWLGKKTLTEKIGDIVSSSNQNENFYNLFKEIKTLFKFGRMTTWLAMQALHDVAELPINPASPIIDGYGPQNDSSLKSIWNGLCALKDEEYKMVGKYGTYDYREIDKDFFQSEINRYCEWGQDYLGKKVDNYRNETVWCMYKRLFNNPNSKEYPGHSNGYHTDLYLYFRENWPEVDWAPYREACRTTPGVLRGKRIITWQSGFFSRTGLMMNMHDSFGDMPDVYKLLDIDPMEGVLKELWTDDGLEPPTEPGTMERKLVAPVM